MDKDKATNLLKDVRDVLSAMSLRYFLIDGTLLGAVRECGFIPHDLDIDLGVFAEDWFPELVTAFVAELEMSKEIKLHHQFGEFDKYFELAFTRDGIKIDLFFYRREEDKRIFHAFMHGGRDLPADVITYEYPAHLIERLTLIPFMGDFYMAPENCVAVLECKYGKDWRTPVKEWDWRYGPHNVRK